MCFINGNVVLIYSFIISSIPWALLFFRDFAVFSISSNVMSSFISLFILSLFIKTSSSGVLSFSWFLLKFTVLKWSNKFVSEAVTFLIFFPLIIFQYFLGFDLPSDFSLDIFLFLNVSVYDLPLIYLICINV